ncbi:DNA methyltransferase [Arthrobacter globiformis]|uniref:DNA methyltransferase n=1 Tax=Arthrobacter globiformis TaxID=1665 RepID=UPI00397DA939
MAHLDTLIAMIPDEKLRGAIEEQIARLHAKTSFGLVFEEHRPETVQLPGFEVKRGDKVVFKDGSVLEIWTVLRLDDGNAVLVRNSDHVERVTAPVADLVVIREFGDPIYPGLQSVGAVKRGGDKPFHTVINAENFHATEMLLYPYEGKVDVIYLDPPYNTGAKDWKYNNDYVDKKDQYRHSKWLSFIEKRLVLARRLLNPKKSVLIFTIDEKEYLRAGLLLEQVFRGCTIQMVTSVTNPSGSPRGGGFARVDEYLFIVFLGEAEAARMKTDMLFVGDADDDDPDAETEDAGGAIWDSMLRRGTNARRIDRENQFYLLRR